VPCLPHWGARLRVACSPGSRPRLRAVTCSTARQPRLRRPDQQPGAPLRRFQRMACTERFPSRPRVYRYCGAWASSAKLPGKPSQRRGGQVASKRLAVPTTHSVMDHKRNALAARQPNRRALLHSPAGAQYNQTGLIWRPPHRNDWPRRRAVTEKAPWSKPQLALPRQQPAIDVMEVITGSRNQFRLRCPDAFLASATS